MKLWKIKLWLCRHFTPHYLIIGHYTSKVIGCTCGEHGKADVLAEEPLSTFKWVPLWKCPICHKEGF